MHRIDTPTAQKDKFGAGKNGFTRGNPQTGQPATDLDDDYFDMLQEELLAVVEAAGIVPDKSRRNQLLAALSELFPGRDSELPVGVPVPWPAATPPVGWLKCNGATFNQATYPKLAMAYPSGSLPDLRGVFIRGWDDGRGLDSGRAILSYAADKMRRHTHGFLFGNGDGTQTPAVHEQSRRAAATTYYAVSGSSGVYITEEGQNETAPCNTAFNYIVRAA